MPNTLTQCECSEEQHESIPDITFKVDRQEYVIQRDQWFERSGDKCVIKFMHGPHKDYWILGLNFFNNYYTVFDYQNKKIGFAKSKFFGTTPSSSFIKWATSGHPKVQFPKMLNLDLLKNEDGLIAIPTLIISVLALLCVISCCYKPQDKRAVRASVDSREAADGQR
mmetsp:Transcript_3416/g.5780  ORF Transcript_3416/g.5780 Transcript_3416/m.5780 type:complete len:167 (-) Transcript_3416:63-563(-)